MKILSRGLLVATLYILSGSYSHATAADAVPFKVQFLTIDSNEGCDIADVDSDGKLDVIAGRNWYRNGDWLPRPVRLIEDREGYVRSNGEWALDVNQDGRSDVVSMDFVHGNVYWYENPGQQGLDHGLLWTQHLLAPTGFDTNEASYLTDLDKDGTLEWITNQWNKTNPAVIWQFSHDQQNTPTLKGHMIGPHNGHGIGFGDLNNDGRHDVLVGTGWYECPEKDAMSTTWQYHADWDLQAACPMIVHDVNGDGISDVITSKAHDFGIYLWQGKGPNGQGKLEFEQQLIDDTYSQAHCLHMADLNGDSQLELITGKRIRAHNGGDPGASEPPIIRYYEWDNAAEKFQAYTIDKGSVGIGLQIRTADLDADGDLEIIVAGKEGTQILWSQLK